MYTNWLKRLLIGVGFALLLGAVTAVITQAQSEEPPTTPIDGEDCQSCHEEITTMWDNSSHSQAYAEENFVAAWQEQGSPSECLACHTTGYDAASGHFEAEGITCQSCHPSDPAEHPQKLVYTDTSAGLCGSCHVDSFNQMATSDHGQEGMSCVDCHNPHDNSLRAGSMQETCRSCHRDESHFYTFTEHADEGMTCTDCHLQLAEGDMGEGHGRRLHTFSVGLDTCNQCHNDQMHFPTSDNSTTSTTDPLTTNVASLSASGGTASQACPLPDQQQLPVSDSTVFLGGLLPSLGDTDTAQLDGEPMSNSTFNFVVLAAIIGLLFGLVGSSWLERWFDRNRDEDEL